MNDYEFNYQNEWMTISLTTKMNEWMTMSLTKEKKLNDETKLWITHGKYWLENKYGAYIYSK